jgi:chromosomal replication initiation ATPase DnaA
LTQQSIPILGRTFYRDHSSVIHGCKKIKYMMETNPQTRALVERLEAQLREAAKLCYDY